MSCDCYRNSRLDPAGNITLLVTCKACLAFALGKIRESVCNSPSGVIQLELFEGYGADDNLASDVFQVTTGDSEADL